MKSLKANYLRRTTRYCESIRELFKNIPIAVPEPKLYDYKKEIQLLLTNIGGECYINKLQSKPSPIKSPRLRRESQNKGGNMKRNPKTANEACND